MQKRLEFSFRLPGRVRVAGTIQDDAPSEPTWPVAVRVVPTTGVEVQGPGPAKARERRNSGVVELFSWRGRRAS